MWLAGFGGGCHWCTEAVFQPLRGVSAVRQGFIASDAPDDGWSEAVEVEFDPVQIDLRDLLRVHLGTHASGADHKLRGKYRSAVYVTSIDEQRRCAALIGELEVELGTTFVTRALLHRGFKPSDARFQNYYRSGPDKPFCRAYIEPKLARLRAGYGALLKAAGPVADTLPTQEQPTSERM